MKIVCRDIAELAIDSAKEKHPEWLVDEEKREVFEDLCDKIDIIAEENEAAEINVEVDETTKEIIVTVVLPYIYIDPSNEDIENLLTSINSISFYELNEAVIQEMRMDGIWA